VPLGLKLSSLLDLGLPPCGCDGLGVGAVLFLGISLPLLRGGGLFCGLLFGVYPSPLLFFGFDEGEDFGFGLAEFFGLL
jgi:hypothetical protein